MATSPLGSSPAASYGVFGNPSLGFGTTPTQASPLGFGSLPGPAPSPVLASSQVPIYRPSNQVRLMLQLHILSTLDWCMLLLHSDRQCMETCTSCCVLSPYQVSFLDAALIYSCIFCMGVHWLIVSNPSLALRGICVAAEGQDRVAAQD